MTCTGSQAIGAVDSARREVDPEWVGDGAPSGLARARAKNRARAVCALALLASLEACGPIDSAADTARDASPEAADGGRAGDAALEDGAIECASGLAPAAAVAAPADGSVVAPGDVTFEVALDAPDAATRVGIYVREEGVARDFTIVVLPDTQVYTREGEGLEHYFYEQTEWIVAEREARNIVAVIHNGDVVDNDTIEAQWIVADRAMDAIEVPVPGVLPSGIPWIVTIGNHDQGSDTIAFNRWFGPDRFRGREYYGGSHDPSTNDNNWISVEASGLEIVVVSFRYDRTPPAEVLAWGRAIFEAHPEALGIVDAHWLVDIELTEATWSEQGLATYEALKDVQNLQLMTCGHRSGEHRRTDEFEGNVIHSILADYQGERMGGSGFLRLWEFSPARDELRVRTYSPSLDAYETDENSEFTLPVDLSGAAGTFEERTVFEAGGASARTVIGGFESGRTYEWFAEVASCGMETRTPAARFSVR